MKRLSWFMLIALFSSLLMSGCAAIDFNAMIKPNPVDWGCKGESISVRTHLINDQGTFSYHLPPAVANITKSVKPVSLKDYNDPIEEAMRHLLPDGLAADPVVSAFRRAFTKVSAQAQVTAATAAKIPNSEFQSAELEKYDVPCKITHGQMEDFAKALFTSLLRPTFAPKKNGINTKDLDAKRINYQEALRMYLEAFYDGQFVDRFGQRITKPSLINYTDLGSVTGPITLSISLSDADIAAALTVLLEYLADLLDQTPVLGTGKSPDDKDAVFYPGGNKNKPTVLTVKDLADYKQIPDECVNMSNVKWLLYLPNAAADEAQLVNGLVTQSIGGFGFSVGAFAKFSIGDNETLGTIVKTVASRVAMRIVLASTYWALETKKPK